eukprot:scaffold392_cov234-Pinguiococcus_pyrenoidosus.AAC.1
MPIGPRLNGRSPIYAGPQSGVTHKVLLTNPRSAAVRCFAKEHGTHLLLPIKPSTPRQRLRIRRGFPMAGRVLIGGRRLLDAAALRLTSANLAAL